MKNILTLFSVLILFCSCDFMGENYASDAGEDKQIIQSSGSAKISGKVSYPSEAVPDDLIIVFRNVDNGITHNCSNWDRKNLSYSYELEAPGNYEVYAITAEMPDYRAYYSEFVTCGLNSDCPSHKPIVLRITEGAELSGIDPGDWYAE